MLASYDEPVKTEESGVSAANLKTVQEDMLGVTQDAVGTANYMFGDYKIKVAAKTGTAENPGSDNTAFICYAPYDKPKVAVAVMVEHGVRNNYSLQIAKDMLDSYFFR